MSEMAGLQSPGPVPPPVPVSPGSPMRPTTAAMGQGVDEIGATTRVTRFEVIDETGRALVRHGVSVELSFQDEGRTLKVFLRDRAGEAGAARTLTRALEAFQADIAGLGVREDTP